MANTFAVASAVGSSFGKMNSAIVKLSEQTTPEAIAQATVEVARAQMAFSAVTRGHGQMAQALGGSGNNL